MRLASDISLPRFGAKGGIGHVRSGRGLGVGGNEGLWRIGKGARHERPSAPFCQDLFSHKEIIIWHGNWHIT